LAVGLRCKRCGSEEHVKNGLMRNKQRYRCKDCGLNFTDTPPRARRGIRMNGYEVGAGS
jgi:transposase